MPLPELLVFDEPSDGVDLIDRKQQIAAHPMNSRRRASRPSGIAFTGWRRTVLLWMAIINRGKAAAEGTSR